MNLLNKNQTKILNKIFSDNPDIIFTISDKTYWDPDKNTIFYKKDAKHLMWSIFHEMGHALSEHSNYSSDVELVMMESEAWQSAKKLSKKYGIKIEDNHIEDCLDSYRDWLHKRSTCPKCTQNGIQKDKSTYSCLNCYQTWSVTNSRFCRTYRKTKNTPI